MSDENLEGIEKRYAEAENVLEDMIDAIQRKEQKVADKIKNGFLIILTAMSTFATVDSALSSAIEGSNTYIAAIISVVAVYILYRIVRKISER